MLTTEEEAKTKRCIGSACMAWRWAGYRDADGVVYSPNPGWEGVERVGYCGKAGRP